jgi:hypothetical protein
VSTLIAVVPPLEEYRPKREKPDRRDTLWNSRKSRTRQVTATNEIEVSNRGGALAAHPYLHKGGQMSSVDIYRWRRVGKLLTNTCWIVCGQKDGVQKRDTPSRCVNGKLQIFSSVVEVIWSEYALTVSSRTCRMRCRDVTNVPWNRNQRRSEDFKWGFVKCGARKRFD